MTIGSEGLEEQSGLPPLRLWQWLRLMDEARNGRDAPFLIGGSGHLLLSAAEEDRVTEALSEEVLPEIVRLSRGRRLLLLCGLAPGADLLFQRVAQKWLLARGIVHDAIGLLPVPTAQLTEDWSARANRDGYTVSARDRARILSEIDAAKTACAAVVQLFESDAVKALDSRSFRQQQYRVLGAVLATRADALVAVLRHDDASEPGGTAEVVAWRRDTRRIPESVWPATPQRTVATGALFLINPRAGTAAEADQRSASAQLAQRTLADEERVVRAAEEALASGNDLLCNDLVYRAFERGLRTPALAWLRVQSLASAGNTVLARRQFDELAPAPAQRDSRWFTLLGRLEKDLGLRAGASARQHFLTAAESYLQAWQLKPDSYPAINAATLFLLAGDREQSMHWAQQALRLASATQLSDEAERYFLHATIAEASLLLGDEAGLRQALAAANQLLPGDYLRRQVTLRQLRRVCAVLDVSPESLRELCLPPLIFVGRDGPLEQTPPEKFQLQDADALPAHAVLFASLSDVLDLSVIEPLMRQGRSLFISLPFSANAMIEHTHRRYGAAWGQRLESCLAGAQRVSTNRGYLESEMPWSALQARRGALGLALLWASRSDGEYQSLRIRPVPGGARLEAQPALQAGPLRMREAVVQGQSILDRPELPQDRRMVGLIFADIAGFMRLDDPDLPRFWNVVMRGIAETLDAQRERILLSQTWGDALHVVTTDAATAALIAIQIQAFIQSLVERPDSPFPALELRVAAHYAPVFEGFDPIQRARTYFGTQLTFTARIEPVTPPGQVYVTEGLAAQLAIEAPDTFACEYVGEIQLAKRFGNYRVYAMRATTGESR